jgi:hypothetical protein
MGPVFNQSLRQTNPFIRDVEKSNLTLSRQQAKGAFRLKRRPFPIQSNHHKRRRPV